MSEATVMVREINEQVTDATRSIRKILLGEELAKTWECTQSNVSYAEKNGTGEIKKLLDTMLSLRNAELYGADPNEVEEAINKTLAILARAGGYQVYKPINHDPDEPVQDVFRANKLIMQHTFNVIKNLETSISLNGREVRIDEPKLTEACDKLIATLMAVKQMSQTNGGN